MSEQEPTELQKTLKRIEERWTVEVPRSHYAKLVACAKFYGDMNNWLEIDGTDGEYQQIKNDANEHTNGYAMGGKFARDTMREVGIV